MDKIMQKAITLLLFSTFSCSVSAIEPISIAAGAAVIAIGWLVRDVLKKEKPEPEQVLIESDQLLERVQRDYKTEFDMLARSSNCEEQLAKRSMSASEVSMLLDELCKQKEKVELLSLDQDHSDLLYKKNVELRKFKGLKDKLKILHRVSSSSRFRVYKKFNELNKKLPYDIESAHWRDMLHRAQSLGSNSPYPLHKHLNKIRSWLEEAQSIKREADECSVDTVTRPLKLLCTNLEKSISAIVSSNEYQQEQKNLADSDCLERQARARQESANRYIERERERERQLERQRVAAQEEEARARNRDLDQRERELRVKEERFNVLRKELVQASREKARLVSSCSELETVRRRLEREKREKDDQIKLLKTKLKSVLEHQREKELNPAPEGSPPPGPVQQAPFQRPKPSAPPEGPPPGPTY